MPSAFGNLNGDGPQQVWVNVYRTGQSGNQSHYHGEVRYYGNGYGSWITATQYWSADFGGHRVSGTFNIPQNEAYWTYKTLWSGDWSRNHDANGNGSAFNVNACIDSNHSRLGDGCAYTTEGAPPRIAKVPGKPPRPVFVSAGTVDVTYNFTNPADNGGSGITHYDHQSATDPGFTQNLRNFQDNSSPAIATGLVPGSNHYFRYRAANAVGAGPWSDTLAQVTMPSVPPGLQVEPFPSGRSALLMFDPPGGVTGVTRYTWERRIQGDPSGEVVSDDHSSDFETVENLTPGTTYEWRGGAFVGTYQSPWTDWMAVTQPNPNTNPGDYFDGDSTDKPDIDFVWTGPPGNSTSQAKGRTVPGWMADVLNSGGQPLAGVHQVTGGAVLPDNSIAGKFAARAVFHQDATGPGNWVGTAMASPGWADVTPGGTYFGSIFVYLSRPQVVAAQIVYDNGAGTWIATITGVPELVPALTWTRLHVSAVAPTGAEVAAVHVADIDDGSGDWSLWLSGDSIIMDGAMISLGEPYPYFDGDTPDQGAWDFSWVGEPRQSASQALPVDVHYDPLADPNCVRPPAPPRPPFVTDECVVPIGTWQRYWAVIPETVVTEWLSMVPTIAIHSGTVAVHQVRVRLYPNPLDQPPETFVGDWSSEQIISYMPANSTVLIDGVDQRTWASVGGGPRLRADHLLYGSDGSPATWPVLSCGAGYLASFDTPVDAGVLDIEIALTQRRSA